MEKNFSNIKYYITLMEEVLIDIFLIKEKGAWGAFKPTQNEIVNETVEKIENICKMIE